jgi:hypothetical protein
MGTRDKAIATVAGGVALLAVGALAYQRFLAPAAPAPTTPGEGGEGGTLEQVASLVGAYTAGAATPEVLRQKILNYQRMINTPGPHLIVPGRLWYENEIAKLRARLQAAEIGQQQTSVWRSLGQTGAAVGILTGITIAAYFGVSAIRKANK